MRVYIATVMHEYGSTSFAAITEEERNHKVARWCREYMEDKILLASDSEVIEHYFDGHPCELLFIDEDEI